MGDVMKNCKFINELNRLRKSSSDSIDNVEKFDQFKSYMHVVRKMEEDLKGLLRKVNASGKKTLVLLCGSAGDGKSHLLSYLKNLDEEHLIDDYFVYNDATESSAPSKTAIETLNEFLSDYRDENLASLGQNVILAINLGVLSNFIDSKYADHFCTLRKYIENSDILTSRVNNNEYDCESNFQHISFSDYNLYSLSAEGIHADYIEKLLEKVFIADEENLFYKTYSKECLNCSLAKKCPVKLNYDYMKDKKRQRFVAELLVKTIIQDKMILTTREILNFIYDIIVSPRFSVNHFHNLCIDNSAYLKEFVKQITPALLFESADITALMNMLKRHDPLLLRSEEADTQMYREQGKNVEGKPVGILIFDYKGDYNETKTDFVEVTNATIYKPYHLPFNPLALTKSSVFKPLLPMHTANAFKDTLSKAFNLGPKQQNTLLQCILETYRASGIMPANPDTWDEPAPTLYQVYQRYMNDEEIKKGDSLSAALDTLMMFEVFEANPNNTKTLFEILNGVVVIDLSSYDENIQSLVVAITLDLFYSQMQALGSSKMEGNYRQLTKMILVDEADNFMSRDFPSLKKILKEGREFGVGTILSTQSLKHFGSGDDDYAKYILTWVVHNVSDLKNSDIDFVFKTESKSQESSALFNAIKTLEKHHSVVKIGNDKPVYMKDKAFWQLYKELY